MTDFTPADSVLAPEVDPTARAAPAGAHAPTPDLRRLEDVFRSETPRSVGTTILAVLAVLYTLHFAREFALPLVCGILMSFLLSPIVRGLHRFGISRGLGSALVVLALLGLLGGAGYALAVPAQAWMTRAPHTLGAASARLRKIRQPVEQVSKTAEQVARAASVTPQPPGREVVVATEPTITSRFFGATETLLAALLEVVVLLYFLLAAGDLFLQKLIRVLPTFQDKRRAVSIARETEASISAYLITVAMINVGEGLVVAGAMWLLGMPNPLLWGALAALLEWIPYLGALTMIGVLAVAGLATFDSVGHGLLAPACFAVINLLQAYFVTPVLLGRRLTLNPVAIFVNLSLWFFLWGIPGAFLSVPLLATFKIFCDHIAVLAPIGEFLGERED